jgi:hypothetical protein
MSDSDSFLSDSKDILENISGKNELLDCKVRSFKEGDEESLVSLFNQYYEEYAGHSERTLEHWKWACLSQPGIGKEGLYVAEIDDSIVGYAAVRRPQTRGGVFYINELCYNRSRNRSDIALSLITEITLTADAKGSVGISIEAPYTDEVIRESCSLLNCTKSWGPKPSYAVVAIDLPELISRIILNSENQFLNKNSFSIRITDIPEPNIITVKSNQGKLSIMKGEKDQNSTLIETDYATVNQIIFGSTSIIRSALNGQIKIKPRLRFFQATRILSKLKLKLPWFIPRTDQI